MTERFYPDSEEFDRDQDDFISPEDWDDNEWEDDGEDAFDELDYDEEHFSPLNFERDEQYRGDPEPEEDIEFISASLMEDSLGG